MRASHRGSPTGAHTAGEKRLFRRGDAYVIPPDVPHGAVTGDEGCSSLDVFSPPREGLRELLERSGNQGKQEE
jgi:quercetin dioxygenase-like cupin family protein